MTKNITKREQIMNGSTVVEDVLVPLQTEEKELAPYPAIEYDVLMHTNLDKLIRDVNNRLEQGRQTEWGIQVVAWPMTTYYQSRIRWNVDLEEDKVIHISGLENEPDLYDDVTEDGTTIQGE